jgi:hypothetical protein
VVLFSFVKKGQNCNLQFRKYFKKSSRIFDDYKHFWENANDLFFDRLSNFSLIIEINVVIIINFRNRISLFKNKYLQLPKLFESN